LFNLERFYASTVKKMQYASSRIQRATELHRPAPRVKHFRKVIVEHIDEIWSADLVDMSAYASENNGKKWLLNIVDTMSRFAWSVPMKSKTAEETLRSFKQVLETSGRQPRKIWFDRGSEFINASMKAFLKQQKIIPFHAEGPSGAVMVERLNRSLKEIMWKRFSINHSYRWVDMLSEILHFYNTRKHRSIGMTPTEASKPENEQRIIDLQDTDLSRRAQTHQRDQKIFRLGDWVRISRQKMVFSKGYTARWSEEIFHVTSILHTNPPVYELVDLLGKKVIGGFYSAEIQATTQRPTDKFLIQHIIGEKKQGGRAMKEIQWMGYGKLFDSWIPADQLTLFPVTKHPNKKLPHPIGEAQMFKHWTPKTTIKSFTVG